MKNKWIAILGVASAAVLSSHATLLMDWSGVSNGAAYTGYVFTAASVDLSGITSSSATKDTDGFADKTAVTVAGFGGTGSLSVDFFGGKTFNLADWSFVSENLSGNSGRGLGVATSTDGNATRSRGIDSSEALVFTIDTASLVLDAGETLQFRVGAYQNPMYLYEQTGASAGASLESAIAASSSSGWYNVDGLQTFAVRNNGTGSQTNLASLEFQVIPEPATLGMVAACGAGILFIRRRFML